MADRIDPSPARRGVALIATTLSLLACYGVLGLLAALSAAGIVLAPNETIWKGAIVAFALLAASSTIAGWRRHRSLVPGALAVVGVSLLAWLMYVRFDRALELLAFVLLLAASVFDALLRRAPRCPLNEVHDVHARR